MNSNNFQQTPLATPPQSQVESLVQDVKPKKRKIIILASVVVVGLAGILFTVFYLFLRPESKPGPIINDNKTQLETSVELVSNHTDWPTFVNLQAGYTLKYPRELLIREMHSSGGYIPFVTNDVAFELRASKPMVGIVASVNKDANVQSLTDWIKNHSGKKVRSEERYFETVENLRKSKVGSYDAVDFIERSKFCFEGPCSETLTRWLVVNKDNSLLGLSCSSCPKGVELIWNEMANSLVIINNHSPAIAVSKTSKYSYAGISINYPSDWFIEPKENYFSLSSFNKEGFSTGSYLYGIEVSMGKCGYASLLDCMRNKLFQGTNKTEQELADAFGGVVEKIDTLLIEGYIYGQMKPETYRERSTPLAAFLISKKNKQTVWMFTELSLYMGSFELNKRLVDYYYPAIKEVVNSVEVL